MSFNPSDSLKDITRLSRYAQYNRKERRRETWEEQVKRVFRMHRMKYTDRIERNPELNRYIDTAENAMFKQMVLGSQRALQFGGPAILRKHARIYNCAATYMNRMRSFQEVMWLLLCGCGVGISVQYHHVQKLPMIEPLKKFSKKRKAGGGFIELAPLTHVVDDSIEGWADALGCLMSSYFSHDQTFPKYFGREIKFDYSKIRPKGAKISFMSGKAPGGEPLKKALDKIKAVIERALTDGCVKLRTIDVFDIVMHSSDAVLAGGIRRSALLTIFSLNDELMMKAKTGSWFIENPQRARSNNSALLLRNKTTEKQFQQIFESTKQFGEPGFIWADDKETLFNPCVEVSLYAHDPETKQSGSEMCNLSEINMKMVNSKRDFMMACRAAAILGTLQAGYTDFPYLGKATENIVRREALLGCSMTGMMDRPQYAFNPNLQRCGAIEIKRVNKIVAKLLGINPSARTTCVKPAGSTSCILGTASGIHPHHSTRYFRRIQCTKIDPIAKFYAKYNPSAVEESVWSANKTDNVITTLIKTDTGVFTKTDVNAIDLLEKVKLTQKNWVTYGRDEKLCTQPFLNHNVSNTINVKPSEWGRVANFIYENRFYFAGISLLSHSGDKDYNQAPFQAVHTEIEIAEKYGNASLFASGLIIHALRAFDGNLYAACACFLGHGEKLVIPDINPDDITNSMKKLKIIAEKKSWIMRAKKFTERYFEGESKKMTYCLKDVDALKKWHDLNRTYKPVPWTEMKEDTDETKPEQYVACGGGKCMIWKM